MARFEDFSVLQHGCWAIGAKTAPSLLVLLKWNVVNPSVCLNSQFRQNKVQTMSIVRRVEENAKSEGRFAPEADTNWNIIRGESRQTCVWSFLTNKLAKLMNEEKQMTGEIHNSTGASSNFQWHSINWKEVQTNVNRLQVRIVKALQEGRWGLATSADSLVQRQIYCR